jgi:hypothetical protein
MHPPVLSITIDPTLAAYRPEITYTWRTLLSAMGYAWVETPWGDAPADLVYAGDLTTAPPGRLVIVANPTAWANPQAQRLAGVEGSGAWERPRFAGETTAAGFTSLQDGRSLIERDLIFDCFWLLSGQEERQHPRGKHGYLDLSGTPTLEHGILRVALVTAIARRLELHLQELGLPAGLPRWPHSAVMAATCGHDVDYPEIIRWLEPLRILARQGARGLRTAARVALGGHSHWHFRSWMALEHQHGARSAFYFVARKGSLREYATGLPDSFYDINAPQFRTLFRELAAEGWEIGLHASYLAYTSAAKFAAERAALATASGQPISGNRHHYWHLNPEDPEETLLIHEQVGFTYDASLTHNRYLGWRRGANWPFYPWHTGQRRALGTLQLPTAWMDDHLFGQRADNPGDRMALLNGLVQRTAEQQGMLLVDVHDYVYDDALFPGWAATYSALWAELFARRDVWFATPEQIAHHWIARTNRIERTATGLTPQSMEAVKR